VNIHPSAVVSPRADLAPDVRIGPFCVIEPDVVVGPGCVFESHVVVRSGTTLGADNHVFEGAVLGGVPQHIHAPEQPGRLSIGSGNIIREHTTIHRALRAEDTTVVGDHNFLMINVHVAHDCRIGNRTIIANNVMLAGHVTVEDRAYLSGAVGVHQFCRIGTLAMVGGQGHINKDVPPFVTVDGLSSLVVGVNCVGLRRAGYRVEEFRQIKSAYRVIYRSELTWEQVLQRLQAEFSTGPAAEFHRFLASSTRGIVPERRPRRATIRLYPPAADSTAEQSAQAERRVG